MSFTFNPDEKWDVSTGRMLPDGNHVCTILEIDATQTSRGGYPMIEVKVGNERGDIRDWLVISDQHTFGKFTSLVLAAGIPTDGYPQPERDFDPSDGRPKQEYAQRLLGRKVGVVVRDEPDNRNPGQTRPAVKGYKLPGEITDDMPADTRGLPTASAPSASRPDHEDDRVPF
jgi:hypothetical protein